MVQRLLIGQGVLCKPRGVCIKANGSVLERSDQNTETKEDTCLEIANRVYGSELTLFPPRFNEEPASSHFFFSVA